MLSIAKSLARLAMASLSLAASACTSVQYFLANAPTRLGAYDRVVDLKYGDDPRQRLDAYSPRKAQNRPVVVFWYGGSWLNGAKSNYRFVGASLAERGFVVLLPDYRLYPAVKFPLFLEDAAHAVAWAQRHAAQLGGDPHRIVLMGHSAGAHMAAFLAFNHGFLARAGARPQWIKGLVGLSGPYALRPNSRVLHEIFAAPYSSSDWQPVQFVDERSPPTLLFHGTQDTVVEVAHAERLRDALRAQGVPVEARILNGRKHADTVAAFALGARYRAPVLADTVRFIERVTSTEPSTSSVSSLRALPRAAARPAQPVFATRSDPSP
jgi:acetyl esterase/lipase